VAHSLSPVKAAAQAQPASADAGRQPANRTEAVQAAGRLPAPQPDRQDQNASLRPLRVCNIYVGT
ncbi:hypothetical protein AAHH78_41290, partial [Burkholderia pseudomallei]